ncbi:SDR family oxidoreductase [Pseudomonas corrugata]|uniref:SDR family oxidoreductase n=1 Tax=Pseudomonas corrugata TaxID=47879 RepID=UPI001586CCEC|nr:SDR family oxidoreductase [Pseudomonas corrugata]MCI0997575.1 SDR family oxidoreductase [Pseudomonas corrugata]NUT64705.1 SDR family oxidoreductase [Pseudomonas corrugata]
MKNLFSITNKIALVSGGSGGIGRMIAQGLVENGVKTYIVARDVARCRAAAAELSQSGQCIALPGDLGTLEGVRRLTEELAQYEGHLDILVNNAGALSDTPLDDFSEDDWDSVMDLNLKSPFFLTQQLLPLLRRAATPTSPARVINIGSVGGLRVSGRENYAYVASKAGLHHLTRALAKRLGSENITVNAIAPGPFPSKLTESASEEAKDAICKQIPRGRFGEAEDIAGAVIYLSSRAGAYVTATLIPVDGGIFGTL